MDMQSPGRPIDPAGTALSHSLLNGLLRMLVAALPIDNLSPEMAAETAEAAREMFFMMQPHDPVEAAAAVRAVAAHFACMDMYARAARRGLSEDTVRSLHAAAKACSRASDAAFRSFHKSESKPSKKVAAPRVLRQPVATPRPRPEVPKIDLFQPRDRFGQPLHRGQTELMTMAQRRAVAAWPRDPVLEALAIAEEEAMIAEQKASEANDHDDEVKN